MKKQIDFVQIELQKFIYPFYVANLLYVLYCYNSQKEYFSLRIHFKQCTVEKYTDFFSLLSCPQITIVQFVITSRRGKSSLQTGIVCVDISIKCILKWILLYTLLCSLLFSSYIFFQLFTCQSFQIYLYVFLRAAQYFYLFKHTLLMVASSFHYCCIT